MSPPIEYLGKICFSLHLMHFWIVQAIGQAVFDGAWSMTGNGSLVSSHLGFFVGHVMAIRGDTVCQSGIRDGAAANG